VKQADIIHLHWINGAFVSVAQIKQLQKPVVWTMRDEWPYTGGCHYSGECVRFKEACGQCPILGSSKERDLTRIVFNHKAKLRGKDIRFVAISNWIAQRAQQSALLRNESVELVLNCIDSCFIEEQSLKKSDCREHFGFDQDELLLLCGATDLDSKYKGYSVLEKFNKTKGINCRIVTFGQISDSLKSKIKVPSTHLGNIGDNESLCKLYRACDLFLGPSHMEAFGKTLAEASACGLPVVAYDYGGPRDIVQHGVNGLLVEPFNEYKFVEAVLELCQNPSLIKRYGVEAETIAKEAFSPEIAALAYHQIYSDIMQVGA
jgi:glycosyltransferase involved in cell wall biosynthesis